MAGAVRLYRTVSVPEYDDLRATGAFRPVGGAEGKYFWEARRHAERFGAETKGHYHPDGYRVVAADVPVGIADGLFRFKRLDGIGPARFVGPNDLPHCAPVLLADP